MCRREAFKSNSIDTLWPEPVRGNNVHRIVYTRYEMLSEARLFYCLDRGNPVTLRFWWLDPSAHQYQLRHVYDSTCSSDYHCLRVRWSKMYQDSGFRFLPSNVRASLRFAQTGSPATATRWSSTYPQTTTPSSPASWFLTRTAVYSAAR